MPANATTTTTTSTDRSSRERWLALLEDLVNTDSAPDDHAGISANYDRLVPVVEGLGFTVEMLASEGAPDVMLARRLGARAGAPRVLMLGHVDTVFPPGTAAARPFRVAGSRAFGPGVADMKGGLVVILAALSRLIEDGAAAPDVTLLFNGDEESGSLASRPLIEEAATGQDVALVFEAARRSGAIVSSRRGVARYRLHVTGRAAHSGSNPDAGANALEALAHTIIDIQDIGRRIDHASVTVVLAEGGSRPNIVPAAASVDVDVRFDDEAADHAVASALTALSGDGRVPGTAIRLTRYGGRPAFGRPFPDLLGAYTHAGRSLGVDIEAVAAGGVSDANLTAALGVPTLDGLGPIGGHAHTDDEFIEVASLFERAAVCAHLLTELGAQRQVQQP
ncbi:M20 family metallopeptidase [Nitriliruptor alkaliphilus]|uniref:M20 family metallopeptidase n=1 Tax=Nitriliruptor alkaliphilus TaxID=427918 RepID=UPI0006969F9E|nr:M20 family metallopeptidase [Nitriliruptor alkaliphilus]